MAEKLKRKRLPTKRLLKEAGLGVDIPQSDDRRHQAEDLNISEILKDCEADIEKIRVEILSFKNQGLMKRAANLLRKTGGSSAALGENLYDLHPTKVAEKVLKRLKSHPEDMTIRLELVNLVKKSGRDLSYDNWRTMFVQANVACSVGAMSAQALGVVLVAQERFFSKLLDRCQEELSWMESKLSDAGSNPAYQSQVEQIRTAISKTRGTIEVVKAFQKQTSRGLQGQREKPGVNIDPTSILSMEEIQNFIGDETVDENVKEEQKKEMLKKARAIAFTVRYTPLLHKSARKMLDIFVKMEPEKPMPYFLQARVCMSALNLSVSCYQGERSKALAKQIQTSFKDAYQFYSMAVNKVGTTTSSSTDFAILLEFGNLVHYYYKIAINVLGTKPPREWLKTVFDKAQEAVRLAQESGKADALLQDIQKDMIMEGFLQ